ncbi:uncharacterized protein LOC136749628 [Amia ocellicauda]|uniref:uncharacterized protein LOC136749628 n=1 Tax=Amia ocellicauda TaxID=2972642 RepID=UPI0034641724
MLSFNLRTLPKVQTAAQALPHHVTSLHTRPSSSGRLRELNGGEAPRPWFPGSSPGNSPGSSPAPQEIWEAGTQPGSLVRHVPGAQLADLRPPLLLCRSPEAFQQPLAHPYTPQQLGTQDSWVLQTITVGYSLQFQTCPPPFQGVVWMRVRDPLQCVALGVEVSTLLEKRAIREVPPPGQHEVLYSPYFLVPKKDGGFHPTLDLRRLKCHLKMLTLCTMSQAIMPGD